MRFDKERQYNYQKGSNYGVTSRELSIHCKSQTLHYGILKMVKTFKTKLLEIESY